MPLSGVATYVPTINAFITHWNQVNAEVGSAVKLEGGFGLAELMALRGQLEAAIADVAQKDSAKEAATLQKDMLLTSIRDRAKQFRAALASQMPSSPHMKALPSLPTFTAAPNLQMHALDGMMAIWQAIDANTPAIPHFEPPLVLGGGYGRGNAFTDITSLRTAFNAFTNTSQEAQRARTLRTELMQTTAKRLRQYRQAALAFLPTNSSLLGSLPLVAPKPGAAPPPVELSAKWDNDKRAALLTWTAPGNPDHDRFEVRYHPGPKYRSAEEQVVGTVIKGVLSVLTDFGLADPGMTAFFKVYNISSAGDEKGSNSIKISRPENE